jgi:ACR3 family arsenite transporter
MFGVTSPVVLVTTVGVLTEVPVMLLLVKFINKSKKWYEKPLNVTSETTV